MIKNVILDMGNVLLDFNPRVALDLFCRSEEEKDLIYRELFQGPEWIQGDLGELKEADRFDLVKARVPEASWDALKQCCDSWHICMKPLPGAEAFCRRAKAQGLRLYILSNASDAFYGYFPQFLPLDFFDGVVVSADIHLIKPDRKIYEYLLERYGLQAGECLFLDDTQANVKGARSVGLQAVRFENDYDSIWEEFLV